MSKILLFDKEARNKLLAGAKTLADAVTTTLGPKGNNVALDRPWGPPAVVHDGVSVARDIDLDDRFENIGAKLIKQAAVQTGDGVGDGTTTSILLTYELFAKGVEKINEGCNAMIMRKGIESMSARVLEEIEKNSIPVSKPEDLVRIATISAGNEEIGSKIAEALQLVGSNGLVTVESNSKEGIVIERKEGMQFDNGYFTPLFSNNVEKMNCILEDSEEGVDVLLVNQKLTTVADIKGLEHYIMAKRKLLMIVSDIEGEALETLIYTKIKGGFQIVVVRAPGFGESQREYLEDISYLTDGIVLSEESGKTIKNLSSDFIEMGHAEKVIVDRDSCQIIGGKGSKELIEERINQIKKRIESTDSDFDKNKLSERLAKLTGGVAILKVGAPSESEMIEKKERAKDALEATKAAMAEGIVAGGGVTLYNIIDILKPCSDVKDIRAGEILVLLAIQAPITKLLENSGYSSSEILGKLLTLKKGYGYNIETDEEVDMIKAGIIDPTKVVKLSFKNAVSTAISLLTTKCIVTDKPDKKHDAEMDAIY